MDKRIADEMEEAKFPAGAAFSMPWPEVEVPKGWKKNPGMSRKMAWISLLTLLIAGSMIIFTAGRSEFLPMVFFLILIMLPLFARWGQGANIKESRELHTVTDRDVKLEAADTGWQIVRYRGPYQKLHFPQELTGAPVTRLAEGLFSGNHVLAFVHLPEQLERLNACLKSATICRPSCCPWACGASGSGPSAAVRSCGMCTSPPR